ncbi:helix-turn-helix domain-containing protein [Clostridium sp. DJ247]|uniref:helix-turn-helix domain-containing protein n=1 Tax=Clostridium sp. DJ247 TaxID=2726188 RepID=UPI001623F646|nr:helix-turn-helix domain-containing protein [Clostridium sp. DJ247]MBC2579962.1 helix-turn-helix domain-containing protein [Clostridium sp. DJ247]
MIGLEYVLHLYKVQHSDLAEELGIAKQNINRWIKGTRKIPEKYLPVLSERFNIPAEMLQKELQEKDQVIIQSDKVINEVETLEFTEENIEEQEEKLKTAAQVIVRSLALLEKNKINEIFDKAYKNRDNGLITLYSYFGKEVSNSNVDRKVIYSMLKSIHDNYSPNEERRDITSDCDMELVNKLNELLKEYKSKKEED